MANSIQQELYQKVYDIVDGPNNYNLGVGLTFPNQSRHGVHVVDFAFNREDIDFKSWLEVLLTYLKDIGRMSDREEWEFKGVLWCTELHAKRENGKLHRASVKGTYNSRTRTGKLYVLAHNQPKPIVEIISWEEMYRRISVAIGEGKRVVLERKYRSYAIYRERPTRVEYFDGKFRFTSLQTYCMQVTTWSPTVSGGVIVIEIVQDTSLPLALEDSRILFTNGIIDITVYLSDKGISCP